MNGECEFVLCVCVYVGSTGLEARGLSSCACLESELNTSLVVKVTGPDSTP